MLGKRTHSSASSTSAESNFHELRTQAFVAIRKKNHSTLVEILNSGLDPNSTNGSTHSLLSHACFLKNHAMVTTLLEAKANPNFKPLFTKGARYPIAIATTKESSCIVQTLLDAKANPNIRTGQSLQPLLLAVSKSNPEITKILLKAGASPQNKLILERAVANRCDTTVRLLLAAKAAPQPCLAQAAWIQNEFASNALLQAKADPNIPHISLGYPLRLAASYLNPNIITSLLQANASPSLANRAIDITESSTTTQLPFLHLTALEARKAYLELVYSGNEIRDLLTTLIQHPEVDSLALDARNRTMLQVLTEKDEYENVSPEQELELLAIAKNLNTAIRNTHIMPLLLGLHSRVGANSSVMRSIGKSALGERLVIGEIGKFLATQNYTHDQNDVSRVR